jgi:hypothetical protein
MTKAEIASEYIKKYPADFPNLTLARLIYSENVAAFKDVEDARSSVRYVLGQNGKKKREVKTYQDLRANEKVKNPYSLPESWAGERTIFKLPVQCNRIGYISDLQVPFHDIQAIETAYEYLKSRKVNTIFISGDLVDFYHLSSFQRDPRRRNFKEEYYAILQMLEHMRHHFPTETIYYATNANHEKRYEKYMSYKAPELLSLDMFKIEDLFKLASFKIIPIDTDHVMIGKLPVVHGHTIFVGQTSPASPARTVWMKAKQSAICSHVHQVSEYTVRLPFTGELHTCWTTGCLMSLNVDYNKDSHNYQHGFAYIETDRDGSYRVENKRILNGRVL